MGALASLFGCASEFGAEAPAGVQLTRADPAHGIAGTYRSSEDVVVSFEAFATDTRVTAVFIHGEEVIARNVLGATGNDGRLELDGAIVDVSNPADDVAQFASSPRGRAVRELGLAVLDVVDEELRQEYERELFSMTTMATVLDLLSGEIANPLTLRKQEASLYGASDGCDQHTSSYWVHEAGNVDDLSDDLSSYYSWHGGDGCYGRCGPGCASVGTTRPCGWHDYNTRTRCDGSHRTCWDLGYNNPSHANFNRCGGLGCAIVSLWGGCGWCGTPPPNPAGGGGNCFVAGTAVTLADGTQKPIEEIVPGDHVLSFAEDTGVLESAVVTEIFSHSDNQEPIVLVNGTIRATANHPIYADGRWIRADELRTTQALTVLSMDAMASPTAQTVPVHSLQMAPPVRDVYNIEVEKNHNYFAGGILVHNKMPEE